MTDDAAVTPLTGPCAPWITAADVQDMDYPELKVTAELAATMASVASEVLYNLSAQQFTGLCGPVTVRPIARPVDADTRGILSGIGSGYVAVWGWSSAWGQAVTGGANRYGSYRPPEVELGAYPIIEVSQVKLDGQLIPPNEYQLQDSRKLVRMRPSASAAPTDRFGWPTTQALDLNDDQVGTFSVTYTYGVAPPASGIWAAKRIAQQLVLNACGDESSILPQRVTSITRAGVSVAIVDVMDFFARRLTGIYEVDLFLRSYNPEGAIRKPIAWSPDMPGARRMPQGAI